MLFYSYVYLRFSPPASVSVYANNNTSGSEYVIRLEIKIRILHLLFYLFILFCLESPHTVKVVNAPVSFNTADQSLW